MVVSLTSFLIDKVSVGAGERHPMRGKSTPVRHCTPQPFAATAYQETSQELGS